MRYGRVTCIPVSRGENPYTSCIISVPTAIIVNIMEKVNKQSMAMSQKPCSNSNRSFQFTSPPSPPSSSSYSYGLKTETSAGFWYNELSWAICRFLSSINFTSCLCAFLSSHMTPIESISETRHVKDPSINAFPIPEFLPTIGTR